MTSDKARGEAEFHSLGILSVTGACIIAAGAQLLATFCVLVELIRKRTLLSATSNQISNACGWVANWTKRIELMKRLDRRELAFMRPLASSIDKSQLKVNRRRLGRQTKILVLEG